MIFKISKDVLRAIIAHAQNGLPNEVCGYLAEEGGRVVAHYELTNTDAASDHFQMKPEEQFAAVKDMRNKGLALKAVYHSHPETPARPSVEDIKLAYDPKISYVIVSLAGIDADVQSFRITNGNVIREEITVLDDSSPILKMEEQK